MPDKPTPKTRWLSSTSNLPSWFTRMLPHDNNKITSCEPWPAIKTGRIKNKVVLIQPASISCIAHQTHFTAIRWYCFSGNCQRGLKKEYTTSMTQSTVRGKPRATFAGWQHWRPIKRLISSKWNNVLDEMMTVKDWLKRYAFKCSFCLKNISLTWSTLTKVQAFSDLLLFNLLSFIIYIKYLLII